MYALRIALLIALTVVPAAVRAGDTNPVTIACQDAVGIPGGMAAVQVVLMRDSEAQVAATQNDLQFDDTRFPIGPGGCVINPNIGPGSEADKELRDSILGDPPRVRVIIVSLETVEVIPPGLLYTCSFHVDEGTPLGTYPLVMSRAIASDPEGMQLPVTAGSCNIVVAEATPTNTPTPRCRENTDCPNGQVCVDGECVTPTPTPTPTGCSENDDCPPGQVCVNEQCVTPTPTATPTGCTNNDDCAPGQVCVNNQCVTPTPTPRCRMNNDCPSGQVCIDGMCETVTPSPSATPTTTAPPQRKGGGGCNCEIDPGAGDSPYSGVFAVLVPALVLLLRWRARRATR